MPSSDIANQVRVLCMRLPEVTEPPYVGARGWVGVRLDGELDWDEVAELDDPWGVVKVHTRPVAVAGTRHTAATAAFSVGRARVTALRRRLGAGQAALRPRT